MDSVLDDHALLDLPSEYQAFTSNFADAFFMSPCAQFAHNFSNEFSGMNFPSRSLYFGVPLLLILEQ